VIDLDLLLMGLGTVAEELMLPHPAMAERAVCAEPLARLRPDWVHPVLGVSVAGVAGWVGRVS